MFVRDPAEWAASFIQERAKHGAVEFSVVDEPGFEERYRNLLGAFGKEEIKVRKYESAKGDIVDFFLKLIGLHRGALQREPIVANASISLEALRTLQLFNSLGISIRRGELLESAHWRFVLCVADIFRAGTRSAAGQFAHLCKLSDYVFLREELGICYEDPSASTSQNCSLSDFDPAILSGIGDYLRARSFQEVADLNTAISYLYAYSVSSEIAVRGHLESLGATLPPILIAESEPLRRDASTHRSKLAGQIEYLDFCVHDALSKIPFAPKGFRVRFAEAARKRFRDCYKRG
jgi:hypothetical protein